MKISIIIPTLNEAENISRLIPFLLLNGKDYIAEIIVADGCSTDETVKIARQLGALIHECKCGCRAIQMNKGTELATGEILYFVHADSVPPSSFATDVIAAVKAGNELGRYRTRFDSNLWALKANAWFTRFNRVINNGGDQTLFVTRKLFEELKGYNEEWVIMEEYEFFRRARKKYRYKVIPKEVIVSTRKYDKNSYLRVNLVNLTVFTMFRFGASPQRIRSTYQRLLKHPKT